MDGDPNPKAAIQILPLINGLLRHSSKRLIRGAAQPHISIEGVHTSSHLTHLPPYHLLVSPLSSYGKQADTRLVTVIAYPPAHTTAYWLRLEVEVTRQVVASNVDSGPSAPLLRCTLVLLLSGGRPRSRS